MNAVHRTRVASRRLRELIPVLELDGSTAQKLGRRLRKITRRLGVVRELDVLLGLVAELSKSNGHSDRGLQFVSQEIQKARERAHERLAEQNVVGDIERLGRKLKNAAKRLPEGSTPAEVRSWQWAIDARVARRAATAKDAIDKAGAVYLPERLHAARVALKKLRYGVELSTEARGLKTHADLRLLRRAQDLLGRLHDLQILAARVRQSRAAAAPTDLHLAQELASLQVTIENHCRRLHAKYMKNREALEALCIRLSRSVPATMRSGAVRRAG